MSPTGQRQDHHSKSLSREGFHVMVKPSGPLCNMDCTYCFYLEKEKLYPEVSDWTMPEDILENYVAQYIEAQPETGATFAWQGGEPTLLGLDFFERVVALQKQYSCGKRIENALQTNGILIDDRWAEFLARNRFLVGLSVDGPADYHDRFRVDKGEGATFHKIEKARDLFRKHGVEFNTLTCVQNHNVHAPLEIYRFLKEFGSGFMQFIPIVERIREGAGDDDLELISSDFSGQAQISDWSVRAMDYGKFLVTIFDEWVRQDVGRHFVQIFDVALEAWVGREPSLCVFRKTCGSALALEHNGDLYSCDHFVYPENRLGNILENPLRSLVDSPQQVEFGEAKKDRLPEYCRTCEVRFACNGECPKHRFIRTPEGEPGLNYLCEGYLHFFRHIDPFMRFMSAELKERRAPANVMHWARLQDLEREGKRRPGRNDPCLCGSGRKYKKCCL